MEAIIEEEPEGPQSVADQRKAKLDKFFYTKFGATLKSHDLYLQAGTKFFSPDGSQLKPAALVDFVYKTPIEEVSIDLRNLKLFDLAGSCDNML